MNLNKAFIIGNLTRDPELRQTPSGQSVASFGIATNRFFTDATGQKQQQAEFHNIVAWGRLAEICHQYLKKGGIAFVEGRLQTRSWQDPQGNPRSRTEIIAERIQLGPRTAGMGMGSMNAPMNSPMNPAAASARERPAPPEDTTPIIELPPDGEEIDVKDMPF